VRRGPAWWRATGGDVALSTARRIDAHKLGHRADGIDRQRAAGVSRTASRGNKTDCSTAGAGRLPRRLLHEAHTRTAITARPISTTASGFGGWTDVC